MPVKKVVEEKLKTLGIEVGDVIIISNKDEKWEGTLLPHHAFSSEEILTIKLQSGYNAGVAIDKNTEVTLVKKHQETTKKAREIPFDQKKPTISVIGTGGTIACYIDYRTGAVHPATSAEDLAFSVPEIFDVCNVKARVAFQMLSENIEASHWKTLAHEVAKDLNTDQVHGVVIPHGTDTMGYTAAALSFMLKDLSGPVVLVGAQRSSDRPSSDAAQNLFAAATVAAKTDIGEVLVVMHGESSDTFSVIHRGTKVRKFHTSQRNAFKTVNDVSLGTIEDGTVTIEGAYQKMKKGKVTVDDAMDEDVAMLYSYPGLKPEAIPDRKGIVLIGTGLGHVPIKLLPRIQELIKNDTVVVMTSQCLFGRVNMNIYSVGRDLLKAGVISGEDMLPETAYVKLMWALAHGKNPDEVKNIMMTNIAGEIVKRTRSDTGL
ncbi:MAG: Glu-tRNA(Gln) amidotransferase subunit GatD [Euryarchaeota archaeon]|nr:Glu-tRNA(Gln) amidotransferase subunit GatD [Euryarchaeota archaeon]